MAELYELGVVEAAGAIASGKLSVLEYNQALIAHIDALEPSVKAFAYFDREGWLAAATEMDAEARAGKLRGPLHGIPAGIKDQFLVQGMPCTVAHSWGREGVAPAERERIFERFARGRGSGRRSEGAGLGLAIVKTIAEAHGGRVRLRSEPGRGSRFSIWLPAALPEEVYP